MEKHKPPEQRYTVLAQVAFRSLSEVGMDQFLSLNEGVGWLPPDAICLKDYGLGHDDRAREPQPVAPQLGPRFYDWQLEQGVAESWEECERHAEILERILPAQPNAVELSGEEGETSIPTDLFGDPVPTDLFGTPLYPTSKRR